MAADSFVPISAIVILLIVGSSIVKCARFPSRARQLDRGSNLVTGGGNDDTYKSTSVEEDFNGFDTDETIGYITDVQIDALQNAQEKLSQDQEIYQVDPRCPKFNGNCGATACISDTDCGDVKLCCFNGCILTCVNNTSPPIAIDWIPSVENLPPWSDRTSNVITFPGGCTVSKQQRHSLDLFLKYGHVTKCVCKNKDVVCFVRKRYPWTLTEEDFDQTVEDKLSSENE